MNDAQQIPETPTLTFGDRSKLNMGTTVALVLFHLGALAAPFFFTWTNLAVALALYWVSMSWGIGMGYHRLHTHRGYKVPKPLEYFLALCGSLALEGGPIYWVAAHRCHHQHSDTDHDPHTPRHGGFWAHMGLDPVRRVDAFQHSAGREVCARSGQGAGFYRVLSAWHWVPLTVLGVAILLLGGVGMMLWAIPLRVVAGLHATWLVNSATHTVGQAPVPDHRRFAATCGGSRWFRSAKAGITTTMPIRSRHGTVSRGTSWTSPTGRFACSRS